MAKEEEDEHRTAKRIATIIVIILLLLLLIPRIPLIPKDTPDTNTQEPTPTTEPEPDIVAEPRPDTTSPEPVETHQPVELPEPAPSPEPDTVVEPQPQPQPTEIPEPTETPQPTEIPMPGEPDKTPTTEPVVVPPLPYPVNAPPTEEPIIKGTGGTIPLGYGDLLGYGLLFSIPILGRVIEPIIVGIGSLLGSNVPPAPAQPIRSPMPVNEMPEHFYEFLQASENYFYMNEYGKGLIPTKMVPAVQINSALDACFYNLSREYGGENVSGGWRYRITDTPQGKEGTVFYGNYIIIRFYGEQYINEDFLKNFTASLIDNPYKDMQRVPVPKPEYYRDYVIVMSGNEATVGFKNSSYSYPYSPEGSVVTVRARGTPEEVLEYAESMVDRETTYWEYNIEKRPSGTYRLVATSPEGRAFVYHSDSMQDIREVISLFDRFPSPLG